MDVETMQWEEKRLRRLIRRFRDDGKTYQKIADHYGVSRSIIYQCEIGNFPKRSDLREKLGLPQESIAFVRHCSCGEVHIRKTCPHKKGENKKEEMNYDDKPVEFRNHQEAADWAKKYAENPLQINRHYMIKEFKTKIKVVKI